MLKKISIYGLKSIEKQVIEFSKETKIEGRNGVGKSTIKDAISFVLYGKINNTDRLDDAINIKVNQAKVSAIFNLKGKDYIVERSRTTRGSKPSINGREVEQSDINALFGDHDEFICSNFVGEFMKFSETERREMLLSKFPAENRAELFQKLTGQDPKLVDLVNLEDTEKKVKRQHKEIEAERNLLSSQKELVSQDLFRAQESLKELQSRVMEDVTIKIAQVKNELDKTISNDIKYDQPKLIDTSDIDKQIDKINIAIDLLVRNMPNNNESKLLERSISSKKLEVERVLGSTACPTCKREYDNISDQKNQAQKLKSEILKEFNEWKTLDSEFNDKIKIYQGQMTELEKQKDILRTQKLTLEENYKQAVQIAKDKYEEDSAELKSNINRLNTELLALSEKDNDYRRYKMSLDATKDRVEELTNIVNNLTIQIKKKDGKVLEDILKAFGPKGILFHEILSQQEAVNKLMPENIKIEFMKENKTNDGFKPCFNVISNGFTYQWLSTGMKLEIDMILLSLFDRGFMAVVDNYESYTGKLSDNLKDKQIITLSAKDSDLIINNK